MWQLVLALLSGVAGLETYHREVIHRPVSERTTTRRVQRELDVDVGTLGLLAVSLQYMARRSACSRGSAVQLLPLFTLLGH